MHKLLQPYVTFSGTAPKSTAKLKVNSHHDAYQFSVEHPDGVYIMQCHEPAIFDIINRILAKVDYHYLRYSQKSMTYFRSIHKGLQHGDREGLRLYLQYKDQHLDHFQSLLEQTYKEKSPQYSDTIISILKQQYLDRRQKVSYEQAYGATLAHAHDNAIFQNVSLFCVQQDPKLLIHRGPREKHPDQLHLLNAVIRQYHSAEDVLYELPIIQHLKDFSMDKTVYFYELYSKLKTEPDQMKTLFIKGFQFYHIKEQGNQQFFRTYIPQLTPTEQEAWWNQQTVKHKAQWLDYAAQKQHPTLLPLLQRLAPQKIEQWEHFHRHLDNLRLIDPSIAAKTYKEFQWNIDDFNDVKTKEIDIHY